MSEDLIERLIVALRSASFEQDSEWHGAPFNYVTKPRALMEAAACALQSERAARETAEASLRVAVEALKAWSAHRHVILTLAADTSSPEFKTAWIALGEAEWGLVALLTTLTPLGVEDDAH